MSGCVRMKKGRVCETSPRKDCTNIIALDACMTLWHVQRVAVLVIHATVNLPKTKTSNANLCHQFKKKTSQHIDKSKTNTKLGNIHEPSKRSSRQEWIWPFFIVVLLCRGVCADFGEICHRLWEKAANFEEVNHRLWGNQRPTSGSSVLGKNWLGFWIGLGQSSSLTVLNAKHVRVWIFAVFGLGVSKNKSTGSQLEG